MRVTPRLWIGLAIYVGYVLVIYVFSKLSGVAYTDIGTSAEFTWRGAVLDLAVGAVLLAITTWLLGWWKPALFERKRSHHKWPIFVPALMLILAVVNLFNTDWSQFDASFLVSLLALGLAVGFCEELMSRGLLLTAFRSRLPEVWVWLLTSILFGGMHLINAALGAPLTGTLGQVVIAAMTGTSFYIVRRVTGSLIWAMALHGIWDISAFSVGFAPLGAAWTAILVPVIGILAVAVVHWVIKGTDEMPIGATTAAAPARL
ncbi:hypothetical protein ASC66_00580 [Leifsonia sp. Root4]|uniref:CPBP family intramembrane glutamic endopeptidase n=1 Tax=Leifsonia sp. Root4 TaxID=1736525 RepID=UPI0006FFEB5D|nr:CPBP family intramembrane glutamic endopeptidase [Leifsonia sp. Root4]KQW07540.1 hypothetical protein ASC66_00580 [Leifsonia sp. Root4]